MKRKKNACFKKKKSKTVYCCVMYWTGKTAVLFRIMFTVSRSHCYTLSKTCNRKTNWAKEKEKKSGHNWLHSVCIWPHFRYFNQSLYSGNLECVSIQISAARRSRTDSRSFVIPGFFPSFPGRTIPFLFRVQSERVTCGTVNGRPFSGRLFWPVVGNCTDHTHCDWRRLCRVCCEETDADEYCLVYESDDDVWLAVLSGRRWTRGGWVCSVVTLKYNQTEALDSLQMQVGDAVVQMFYGHWSHLFLN